MQTNYLQKWLVLSLTFIPLILGIMWLIEKFHNEPIKDALLYQQEQHLNAQGQRFLDTIQWYGQDNQALSRILTSFDTSPENLSLARSAMFETINSKSEMLELSLFDLQGTEILRFDRNNQQVSEKPINQLQNKSNRYYLINRNNLATGKTYFSQIDLNEELGIVEQPHTEVIRFLTPVVNDQQKVTAYLKSKMSSVHLSEALLGETAANEFSNIFLVTRNGHYIAHTDSYRRWGWQLNAQNEQTVSNEFPNAWRAIHSNTKGMIDIDGYTFVYSSLGTIFNAGFIDSNDIIPLPNSSLESADLYRAKIIIQIDPKLWQMHLVGHSISDWVVITFLYLALCTALFFYLKRNHDAIELIRLTKIVENTQTNLLTNLGNEIRSPLNSMLSIADLLEANSPRQQRLIQHMRRSIAQYVSLFTNLATAQRIQQGQIVLQNDQIQIRDIANPLRDMFQVATEAKSLEFSIDYDHLNNTRFNGDQNYLQLLVSSLVDNAIKFTDRGYVRVEFRFDDDTSEQFLKIVIEDTGHGMTMQQIDTFKTLFTQGEPDNNHRREGVGSGLWIADELIKLMNGKILIKSNRGKGTSITISLPNAAKQAARDGRESKIS
jgi:signal transduction histidine kinase